jgi:hypothetical protein
MIESDSEKLTRDYISAKISNINNYEDQEAIIKDFIQDVETALRIKWQPYIVKNIDMKKPKENICFLRYFCLFPKYK